MAVSYRRLPNVGAHVFFRACQMRSCDGLCSVEQFPGKCVLTAELLISVVQSNEQVCSRHVIDYQTFCSKYLLNTRDIYE